MALSNTATPKYYAQFREKVMLGEIPVNAEVNMEMQRIDLLIASPDYWYDDLAVEGFVKFCETEMTLTDGSPVHLLDTFKLWAEALLGWYTFVPKEKIIKVPETGELVKVETLVKERLVKKQYLIVARGGAKSMYAAFLHAYFLICDRETTKQMTTAPTMKLADEVISPFQTAITRARGPVFKFLTEGSLQNTTGDPMFRKKLASTKMGIQNFLTDSIIEKRPMRIDKLQGMRTKINTVDEWLSGDVREDVVGAIEQGASKVPGYLIVAISSEGTVRNGSGDTIKMELTKVLRQEVWQPQYSIWWYKLDSIDEVADPYMWAKAQPNIDKTVTYETYQLDVERMEINPTTKNDILAKRFGLPMEGFSYFFTYEETIPHDGKLEFFRMPCAVGADLSQGDDFCAFTFLFPTGRGTYGVKTRSYITENTLHRLHASMRIKYDEFVREGSLVVLAGSTVLDMMDVYDDLQTYIDINEYDVRALGYDPYNAKEFINRWETENGSFGVEKVPQGARTESVPLGELKHLSGSGQLLFDQLLMMFAMGNTITREDTNGNRKIDKKRADAKIDNVAALMDAWVAYKVNKDQFD